MMKRISAIVVDDERKSLDLLLSILKSINHINIIGEYSNPVEAKFDIIYKVPDILFLDIEMPHINGLELIDQLKFAGINIPTVLVTGYDEYALKAIKKSAFDYLLKPVSRESVLEVLSRFTMEFHLNLKKELSTDNPLTGKLRFNTLQGFYVFEIMEIVYVKANGNYSEIFTNDGEKKLITNNLAHMETLLSPHHFIRIGRSHLINVRFLVQVDRKKGNCLLTYDHSRVELPVTKDRIKTLAQLFT